MALAIYLAASGTTPTNAQFNASVGMVMVNQGGNIWTRYDSNALTNYPNRQIGICLTSFAPPGNQISVQTSGIVPYEIFNMGPGTAGILYVSANGTLTRTSNSSQSIGTVDPSGAITVSASYVGQLSGFSIGGTTPAIGAPAFVTALSSIIPSANRQGAVCDAYSSQGDGGGGTFIWNSTDNRPADGGTIISANGISVGRWNRLYDRHINVKWFGAKGDGERIGDGFFNHTTGVLTSATGGFLPGDVGKPCTLYTPGVSGQILHGTITAYSSTNQVTTSLPGAAFDISGNGIFIWGTDDTAAISASLTAVKTFQSPAFVQAPELFFPPGNYCVTSGFNLDQSYNGVSITGSGFWHIFTAGAKATSKITLMTPQTYLFRDAALGMRWADIVIDGNRLAGDVVRFANPADTQTFDRIHFCGATTSGNIHHWTAVDAPDAEIDFIRFNDCFLWGDQYDSTYHVGVIVLNDMAQAFQIDYNRGELRGAGTLIKFTNLGSCNFRGTQLFGFDNEGVWVNGAQSSFEIKDAYNEQDTATFFRMVGFAGSTSFAPITLKNCHLQFTPIYTSHVQRLVLEHCTVSANITSDPGSALITGANGTVDFGIQPLILDDCSLVNGAGVIGTGPGNTLTKPSLVEYRNIGMYGSTTIDVTDGHMTSGSKALACTTSTPFTQQSVGLPVHIINAGSSGADLWSWIVSFTDTGHVTLNDACGNLSGVTGATVHIGNVGTLTPFGYVQDTTTPRSPNEQVGSTGFGGVLYDSNNVMLGIGSCPVGAGVPIIAADYHLITALTANRSTTISNINAKVGSRMRVARPSGIDSFGYTITYGATPTPITIIAGQYIDFEFVPNAAWAISHIGSNSFGLQQGTTQLNTGMSTISAGITVTTNSRVYVSMVAPGGTLTNTARYEAKSADYIAGPPGTGTIVIKAVSTADVVNTLDTSILSYLIVG